MSAGIDIKVVYCRCLHPCPDGDCFGWHNEAIKAVLLLEEVGSARFDRFVSDASSERRRFRPEAEDWLDTHFVENLETLQIAASIHDERAAAS